MNDEYRKPHCIGTINDRGVIHRTEAPYMRRTLCGRYIDTFVSKEMTE